MEGAQDWKTIVKENPKAQLDFQVRVHILEARELQPRDRNGMSDPVCYVELLDKKDHTVIHKKTTICTWDHLFFFEFHVLPEEFFAGKIRITVYDANTILRNVEIGSFELDTGYVHGLQGHEIYRRWVALSDSSGKHNNIQGYLRMSCTVLAPGDAAPAHTEEEEDDEESTGTDLQSMVLLPPSIKSESHKMEISVHKGDGLPKMDTFGKCDGYIAVRYGSNPEVCSEVQKTTFTPEWNEKLSIPVRLPSMSDKIIYQLRDYDRDSSDEIVGTVHLKYSEVSDPSKGWNDPRWVNFYGTPEEIDEKGITNSAKLAKKMNAGYLEGSCFRGRVLTSIRSSLFPDAKVGKDKISPVKEPASDKYTLRFDAYEGSEFITDEEVSVEVSVGKSKVETKKTKCKHGSASWYASVDETTLVLPTDPSQIPDVFINFYKHGLTSKKRFGYIRMKASELGANSETRWEMVKPDVFTAKDKVQVGGFFQFRINLAPAAQLGQRKALTKPTMVKYQFRAHIYQGADLPSGDADAASDPYLVINLGPHSVKTKIIKSTLFPLWYETLTFDVELPEPLNTAPNVHVTCWDWDQFDSDDLLGRFSVPVTKLKKEFSEVPKWFDLYENDPTATEGRILASFQLIPASQLGTVPQAPSIRPKFKDCTVEVSAIGLRELLPYQLLPMQKPFIQFDCGDTKVKTKTCTNPSAANPNHLEVLRLDVKIPEDKLYSVPLNIKVYDDRLITKPMVAYRSLSLTPFLPWTSPPTMEELDENAPKMVTEIPGAALAAKETPAEDHVILDLPSDATTEEDVKKGLLEAASDAAPDLLDIRNNLIKSLAERTLPEVAESFLPGSSEEKEEVVEEKRKTLKNELELSLTAPAFGVYQLYRATQSKGRTIRYEAGKFKGKIRVIDKSSTAPVEPSLDLVSLFQPKQYVVRVYVLEGYQLVPKDSDGKNNPYIALKLNGKTIEKDVQTKKQETSRPQFFKCYEISCKFPQESLITVQCWDWDQLGADDLIGQTKIDLENRIYNEEWKALEYKSIEYRSLWTSSSSSPQGQLKLWVDIMTPEQAAKSPKEDISPPLPMGYEMRVIVWNTREVVFKDKNMSDIFVTGYPEGQDPQVTDVHWRSEDGTGAFNWRMKFPITLPTTQNRFKLQIWDKDILNPNDAIAEANLNFKSLYKRAYKQKSSRQEIEKQWVTMTHPAATGTQGQVEVSFELLDLEEARRRPAGMGRSEPNENPHLDPPVRPETSFNPFRLDKMISKVLWQQHKWKIYIGCGICIAVIIAIIVIYLLVVFA
eukprot:TRINITY_DN648_c0_g1_i1.p1 TRINITY_DN648_c0_g1~~TRINITY_DN648_c0_g1_i1.p1  ORF type:complete len:1282 (+),score=464.21 TRINITY_DN648_c0_g1_i1:141-3986(+)